MRAAVQIAGTDLHVEYEHEDMLVLYSAQVEGLDYAPVCSSPSSSPTACLLK
jgi:hypothetical protein